ncbi:keratin, type I cytoskeletal 9-like [Branchiostoma lanceolatum]|uniref:keratin, type I cytoskeletal 9-like n=1 Tax=Branchiostoma lanceolatum TaxID=7740 RepID=UPI003451A64A
MAESKLLNRLSEDFLECQICLQSYRRPKVLSCLHSFCQQCLEEFLKNQKNKTELDCPTCRSKTLLPGGGVTELKDNFFVESLKDTVDVHKKLTNEGESLGCGSCETKSGAESFCTECGDFLCDECVAIHRRMKVTRGHQVIGVEQLKSESDTVKIKPRPLPPCRIHALETLRLFCVDCSETICPLCIVISHKNHKYEYLADTVVKVKEDILALLAKTDKKLVDLKNADQQAHAHKIELDKNIAKTVEKIKRKAEQTRKQLVALVDKQEVKLLDYVNTLRKTRSKEFSTAIEEIETATVALESAAEFGQNIVEHGSEFEMMAISGEVNGRLKELLQFELPDITDDLLAKAYIVFEEEKTSEMAKPRLGEVQTMQGFRTARFTTLGTTGRLGPTSLGTHYRGQDHEELVQLKDGIQYFTVPDTGKYRIEAAGSAAGWGRWAFDDKSARGRGAVVRGTFQLKKGEVLKILVGQEGLQNKSHHGVGGGGGTFVTKADNTPLVVAGGAGGGDDMYGRNPSSDGTTAPTGKCSSGGRSSFAGGSDGKGATQGDNDNVGGGGGGLLTDGASGKVYFGGTDGNCGGEGGRAFVNGGCGGKGVQSNAGGGFGGGGGSHGCGGGGGGGGGYSGGGRGDNSRGACGGGGGSYNSGSDTSGESGANDGPGFVVITRKVFLPRQSSRDRKRSRVSGDQLTSASKSTLVAESTEVPPLKLRITCNEALSARTADRGRMRYKDALVYPLLVLLLLVPVFCEDSDEHSSDESRSDEHDSSSEENRQGALVIWAEQKIGQGGPWFHGPTIISSSLRSLPAGADTDPDELLTLTPPR